MPELGDWREVRNPFLDAAQGEPVAPYRAGPTPACVVCGECHAPACGAHVVGCADLACEGCWEPRVIATYSVGTWPSDEMSRWLEISERIHEEIVRLADALARAFGRVPIPTWSPGQPMPPGLREWVRSLPPPDLDALTRRYETSDSQPYDVDYDWCWRCDAAQGETNVGLCGGCLADLTGVDDPTMSEE